ncbi:MAG: ATP-grasp ribosomal peptide maturase [Pseudonocardiales bacterium]|nr:ATP-grasp ribosomal peptide maturase [Pseudonocardiales bacterium]
MTVVVLAQELDRTADGVIQGLTDLGEQVMRVDLSWFPQRLTLDAEFRDGTWHGCLRTDHHAVDLASIRAIWVRSPSLFRMPPGMSAVEADYARREAKIGLAGVLLALPGVLWVNRPDLAATAAYKPLQYALAARCGVPVPRTLITNSPSAVSRFAWSSITGVVCKPLTTNLLYEDGTYKMGYTRRLSPEDLVDLRGVELTATQVQDWVPKLRECRAVVVGKDLFAVAIDAGSEAAYVGWRSDFAALSYEVIELPDDVVKALQRFMTELGLCYGAFDLVIGPHPDHHGQQVVWLLECNPGGQYGFLETITEVPITRSLVELLAKGNSR